MTGLELEIEVKALQQRLKTQAAGPALAACDEQGLVAGLIKDFGLGQEPRLRRALYDRLARLEKLHGQTAELLIAEARSMAKAPGVKRPGNYFAKAICLKLREAGIT